MVRVCVTGSHDPKAARTRLRKPLTAGISQARRAGHVGQLQFVEDRNADIGLGLVERQIGNEGLPFPKPVGPIGATQVPHRVRLLECIPKLEGFQHT